ncbi:F-box protein SKIP19-like [Bidens hawaiensis]|uniref:F-box protein SKIP19-like n=1 Tax=Bidens hawaiensis TaxID=980011 RepID=UPI00404ACE3A
MPSKSNPPKPKQEWLLKQPTRNWLELPSDLTLNILQRVGVIDRLQNAQLVCTAWREICEDPAMWRVVCMDRFKERDGMMRYSDICKLAANRSQGQLVDLTTVGFSDHNLLWHVAHRSRNLRRLEFLLPSRVTDHWIEVFNKKSSALCQQLFGKKILKLNLRADKFWDNDIYVLMHNALPLAIGKSLPGLTHLELIGNGMTNIGLQIMMSEMNVLLAAYKKEACQMYFFDLTVRFTT